MSSHLRSSGLTYFGHLLRAWALGFRMAKGAAVLLVHGLVPGWFEHTGSDTIRELYLDLIEEEVKRDKITYRGDTICKDTDTTGHTPAL
jgi:hypothetical protein